MKEGRQTPKEQTHITSIQLSNAMRKPGGIEELKASGMPLAPRAQKLAEGRGVFWG
jgi:hypothetical protein